MAGPILPAISVASGLFGIFSSRKQAAAQRAVAAEQERLGRINAGLIERETMEESRRARRAQTRAVGQMHARSAASGIEYGGSNLLYIQDEQLEFEKQISWMMEAGASRAEMARLRGANEAALTRAGADATEAQGWAQAVGTIVRGGSGLYDWWGSYKATGNFWAK